MVEEPSSICLHLSKRRAASPVELSITLQRGQHPTPTRWVLCVPQAQTPQCQEVRVPPAEQRQLPCPSSWQAACPLRHHRVARQHPHSWAPAPCKRKAAAGCIAKLCVGSFLATHGISSYCFSSRRLLLQSLAKGSSIYCLQVLSFTGRAGEEPAAWKVSSARAVSGFSLMFPPRGASTAGSEDSQQFHHLLWGRTALSLLHRCQGHHKPMLTKSKSSCRVSSEVPKMSQERSWAQEDRIATESPSLFPNP